MSEEKKVTMDDLLCCEPDGSPDGGFAYCDRCKTIMAMDSELTSLRAQVERLGSKPRLGCAGIVRQGEKILLGKRGKEPNFGLWVLPGGGVKFGETFAATLQRELCEEAQISIDIEEVFNTYELVNLPEEHRVIIYLTATHRAGAPTASSDLTDVRFFDPTELKQMSEQKLITPFVEHVLSDYLASRKITHRLEECEKALGSLHDAAIDAYNFIGGANPPTGKVDIIENLKGLKGGMTEMRDKLKEILEQLNPKRGGE